MNQGEKVCQDYQNPTIQTNPNNKIQSLTLMEIEYQNKIIMIEKRINELQILMGNHPKFKGEREDILKFIEKINEFKIKLTNLLNEKKTKNSNYNYRLLHQAPMNLYSSFVFNSDSTLLFAGAHRYIKVFKFKNGKKLLQTLNTTLGNIKSLIFMSKSNLLVSGGEGDQIIFWSQGKNNCWEPYQTIQGHFSHSMFMIVNKDENLLITSAFWDQSISFWRKTNTGWKQCQMISKILGIVSFSLNKSSTKLFVCCKDANIIIIQIHGDFDYTTQIIQTNCSGYQLCLISDSEFAFQGEQEFLKIYYLEKYDFLSNDEEFKIKKKIKVQNTEKYFPSFPCKYLQRRGILIIQNGNILNFFGTNKGEIYALQQSIEFSNEQIYGNISNDGEFLVAVNKNKNRTLQIRRLQYMG